MTITVYGQPNCYPCKGTYRALEKAGVKYDVVDISEDHDAREYVRGLGHQSTPVVVVDGGARHWSGHQPTKLASLIA